VGDPSTRMGNQPLLDEAASIVGFEWMRRRSTRLPLVLSVPVRRPALEMPAPHPRPRPPRPGGNTTGRVGGCRPTPPRCPTTVAGWPTPAMASYCRYGATQRGSAVGPRVLLKARSDKEV